MNEEKPRPGLPEKDAPPARPGETAGQGLH